MAGMDKSNDSVGVAAQPLCVKCGYDLSGLDPGGSCPECGAPVARALRGDLLSAADPSWLRSVYRGLNLVAIGSIIVLLRIPTFGLIMVTAEDLFDAVPMLWTIFEFLTGPLGVAFFLVGVTNITILDPRLALRDQPVGLRRLTRWTALGALVALGLRAADKVFLDTSAGAVGVVYDVLGTVGWLLVAVAAVGLTYHLARLGARIPDRQLVKRTRWNARVAAILFTVVIVLEAIITEDAGGQPSGPEWLVLPYQFACVATMIFVVILMVNWLSFRKPIKRCLAEAR
jgi:hypothetical protein